jgi:signal transduction histidine kinase
MLTNLRKWISPPVFQRDEDKTRTASLINTILMIFIAAAGAYGIFAPIERGFVIQRLLIIVPFVLIQLGLKQLTHWGYVKETATLIVFILWLTFTISMFFGEGYNNPAFMGFTVVVVCAGLLLTWRSAIGWGLISVLTSASVLLADQLGIIPPNENPAPPFAHWVAQALYIFVITILLSQTVRKIDEAIASAKHELDERKKIQIEREIIIKELETRNAELERFTYTVSHDLKSPLITIGGFIGFLEEDIRIGAAEKIVQDLDRIREAKDKMYRLLNELLELSRIGRLINPPEKVAFIDIVNDALVLIEGQLTANNTRVIVQENMPIVHGDRLRLVEVMQNLIDNASKFSSSQPHPQIEIGATEENSNLVFFVRDNGIGINPSFHERIFNLFDKLDPKSEGTGVGLALVKRIIEVHGGKIWVESEGSGKGSTFCFTLSTG